MLEEIKEEQLVFFAFFFHKTLGDFEHTVMLTG